ncbi:hypothetical protein [Nocardia macrotermitis]|uniref:PPE family domain-containing protein n=1 Tax=Nocardia macrotermitis TaxID=2585198 RepID=A0A7K0D3X7_9NOCA|nr:hypothetical protein [Nocardia macrotermitis]MQY20443.1 hypothetical protein [Nocardia macrotermitis]
MVAYEPSKIPDGGENPDSWTHWDIYRAFNPLNTVNAQQAATTYAKIAKDWSSAMSYFVGRINQSSTAAWSGAAAEASRTAMTNYGKSAEDTTDAINALADNVTTAIAGITGTKSGVPEPINSVSAWNPKGWDVGFWEGSKSRTKIDQERDTARENMRKYYKDNFTSADSKIATIPDPNPISSPLNTYTPSSSSTYKPGVASSGSGGSDTHNSGSSSGNAGYSGSGGQSGTSSNTSASTSPASYQNSSTSGASNTTPSSLYGGQSSTTSTTPSSFTSGVGGGSGTDSTGTGTNANPGGGLGKSVPGTTPGTTATAASRAGNSTTGFGGMGGMGGTGKSGDSESTHAIPEWLRTMENTEELLGPIPKTAPGGVIGGQFDGNSDENSDAES